MPFFHFHLICHFSVFTTFLATCENKATLINSGQCLLSLLPSLLLILPTSSSTSHSLSLKNIYPDTFQTKFWYCHLFHQQHILSTDDMIILWYFQVDISPSIRSEDRGFPSRPQQEECPILGADSHQKAGDVAEKSPEEFSIDVGSGGISGQAEAEKNGNEAKKIFHQPDVSMLAGEHFQKQGMWGDINYDIFVSCFNFGHRWLNWNTYSTLFLNTSISCPWIHLLQFSKLLIWQKTN